MIDVLLVNLGTPAAPTAEAVREFLAEFLGDPEVVDLPRLLWKPILNGIILRVRPPKVAEAYGLIWREGGSPLAVETQAIAAGVAAALGDGYRVRPVYRYGQPSVADALRGSLAEAVPTVVLPLFPQRTCSSSGTIVRLAGEVAKSTPHPDALRLVELPPDAPGYVTALAGRYREAVGDATPDHVVVSFHGIPARYDEREERQYTRDCQATADAVTRALGLPSDRVTLAFQSKFGPEKWLTPATADVLAKLPQSGVKHAAVIAPGFLTDGLETLEELAIRGQETFVEGGGETLTVVPAVADHPSLVEAIADCVRTESGEA